MPAPGHGTRLARVATLSVARLTPSVTESASPGITIDTLPGQGSTFTVVLPAVAGGTAHAEVGKLAVL